jgi:hypothetical protein
MRYYFHVMSGGRKYRDERGEDFHRDEDALAHGTVIARELDDGTFFPGSSISITDENGRAIGTVPITAG